MSGEIAPEANGWIAWAGGECPVEPGTPLFIQRRDLTTRASAMPAHMVWSHTGAWSDIIAYKLVRQ